MRKKRSTGVVEQAHKKHAVSRLSRPRIYRVRGGQIIPRKTKNLFVETPLKQVTELTVPHTVDTRQRYRVRSYAVTPATVVYGKQRKHESHVPHSHRLFEIARQMEERELGKYSAVFGQRTRQGAKRLAHPELLSHEIRGITYYELIANAPNSAEKQRILAEIGRVDGEFHAKGIIAGHNENIHRLGNYIRTKNGEIKLVDIDEDTTKILQRGANWKRRIKFLQHQFHLMAVESPQRPTTSAVLPSTSEKPRKRQPHHPLVTPGEFTRMSKDMSAGFWTVRPRNLTNARKKLRSRISRRHSGEKLPPADCCRPHHETRPGEQR